MKDGEPVEFEVLEEPNGRLKAFNVTGPGGAYVQGYVLFCVYAFTTIILLFVLTLFTNILILGQLNKISSSAF